MTIDRYTFYVSVTVQARLAVKLGVQVAYSDECPWLKERTGGRGVVETWSLGDDTFGQHRQTLQQTTPAQSRSAVWSAVESLFAMAGAEG